jgi:hypothetical protein
MLSILSICSDAVMCKVLTSVYNLCIWMIMFHNFARPLKDKENVRHKLRFCAFFSLG